MCDRSAAVVENENDEYLPAVRKFFGNYRKVNLTEFCRARFSAGEDMYQQPFGYGSAPGLAPGLSAPSGYENPPLIPPNFNFNAPVIHFGQTLSGATTISTPNPSAMPATPMVRPAFVQEVEGPRPAPTTEDQLHTIFIGDIPDNLSDEWMDRICRACPFLSIFLIPSL